MYVPRLVSLCICFGVAWQSVPLNDCVRRADVATAEASHVDKVVAANCVDAPIKRVKCNFWHEVLQVDESTSQSYAYVYRHAWNQSDGQNCC